MKGSESTELKIKTRELQELFPKLFEHINLSDVFFIRIDKGGLKEDPPLRLYLNDMEPYNSILPYDYIFVVYQEFDFLNIDQQFQAVAHQLLRIPKDYKDFLRFRMPDIVMFNEENLLQDWLKKHKFSLS